MLKLQFSNDPYFTQMYKNNKIRILLAFYNINLSSDMLYITRQDFPDSQAKETKRRRVFTHREKEECWRKVI